MPIPRSSKLLDELCAVTIHQLITEEESFEEAEYHRTVVMQNRAFDEQFDDDCEVDYR